MPYLQREVLGCADFEALKTKAGERAPARRKDEAAAFLKTAREELATLGKGAGAAGLRAPAVPIRLL